MRTCGFWVVAISALIAACSTEGENRASAPGAGGTIVISASADPDILSPPLTLSVQGKQIVDQVFDNLADIGSELNTVGDAGFTPRLARSWKWAPDSSWLEFALRPDAMWHDAKPVTSEDVRFTFALLKNPDVGSPLSPNVDAVDSVSVPDAHTVRVWLSSHPPNLFFRIAGSIAILPSHLLRDVAPVAMRAAAFSRNPVGSGRFRFESWKPGQSVTLVADSTNYRGRPSADRVVWLVSLDYNAAAQRFLAGDADFLDVVRPEYLARSTTDGRRVEATPSSLNYGYVAFNLRDRKSGRPHPVFSDRNVRRALIMAVDRAALVRNVFDTLGSVPHGPVTSALPTSDQRIGLPYDTAQAGRLLDAAGWLRTSNGVREKHHNKLKFSVLVPSSSAIRMQFAVLLQEQWRRIGADVKIEQTDAPTFGSLAEAHDFDSMINAWQIDPDPGSARDEWMSTDRRPGGMNFVSYSNSTFDAVIDSAAQENSAPNAITLYRRAYQILTDDAPAMWLYESHNVFGISSRIEPVGLRADAWWAQLADWRVR